MKFLLDEHVEGFEKKLIGLDHQVESAKKLKEKDPKLRNDFNIINYAKDHDMILITKDKENGQTCDDNGYPCIWLSDDRVFEQIILPELKRLKSNLDSSES